MWGWLVSKTQWKTQKLDQKQNSWAWVHAFKGEKKSCNMTSCQYTKTDRCSKSDLIYIGLFTKAASLALTCLEHIKNNLCHPLWKIMGNQKDWESRLCDMPLYFLSSLFIFSPVSIHPNASCSRYAVQFIRLSEIHCIKDARSAILSPILIISFMLQDKHLPVHPSSMQGVCHIKLSLSGRVTELVTGRS